MKMFKLMGKRGFAVFTSLALCASLVAPSFAATFGDLQQAIRYTGEEEKRFGENEDVVAWASTDDEGNTTVNVRLEGNVDRKAGEGEIAFSQNKNVVLDLNGQTINGSDEDGNPAGKGGAIFNVKNDTLTIKDSSDEGTGKITGGNASGIRVTGGNVTLESGAITGNSIREGSAGGGGVYVTDGSFTMKGGVISDNTAQWGSGGGVGVSGSNSKFTMDGGEISNNTVKNDGGQGGGGGVWVKDNASFEMNGGKITENTVEKNGGNGGGVAIHQGKFTMTGGEISNNESSRGTGVLVNANSRDDGDASFTMSGGYVAGEDGKSCIYLEESDDYNATFKLESDAVLDGTIRLGKGTQVITNNVEDPNSDHKYTNFDMMADEEGSEKLTDEDGNGLTIGTGDTETEDGYTAEEETFLDINYNHEYGEGWVSAGSEQHGHKCKYCPVMTGLTAHNWDNGTVTTEPTCTTDGVKTYECGDCHETKTETIPANGHTWDDGNVTTEPTCATEGEKTFTCTVCHATRTESVEIDPNKHTGIGEFKDKGDNNHHKVCSACGKEVSTEEHIWNGGVVTTEATAGAEGERTYTCTVCGATKTEPIPYTPDTIIEEPFVPLAPLPDEVEIDDPEVPLAGLLTRADVIGYLWVHSGSPNAELSDFPDVPEDHEWAVAIGWAQDMGIAVADVDGNFRPDDLVLRSVEDIELSPEGELEQFLNRYAVYAGIKLKEGELFIALEGEWDDIIMGEEAQVIFDDFFARLELALAQAA